MIDPAAAASLRRLFKATHDAQTRLVGVADILFENVEGTRFQMKAKTPAQAADVLQHIANQQETGIFNRDTIWDVPGPLYFRMNKRVKLGADQKEHVVLAFNFTFREFDKPSSLWMSSPDMSDYYWLGDEKIENQPPFSCQGPALQSMIDTLREAGDNWQRVNFVHTDNGSHIKLVHSR